MRSFIDMVTESFSMSIKNIKSNKMRSFLTTLGIIIGVTAVIALITVVSGVQEYMMNEFSAMGAGKILVNVYGTPLKTGLNENDLEELAAIENIKGISPTVSITTSAERNGEVFDTVTVTGKNDIYFQNSDGLVTYGRVFNSTDMAGDVQVCIIDQDMADNLFLGEDPIGKEMKINGITYTVVGLQGESDDLMTAMSASMSGDSDGTVTIPYKNALKMAGKANVTSVEVYVDNTDYTDEVQDAVENVLYRAFNNNDDFYSVFSMDSLLDAMNTMMSMFGTMLAAIASIALVVGGIGIMNMMLVTVTERTKEIGLRKALGAEPVRIQFQFLLESIVLSLIGGIIGIILGVSISYIVAIYVIDMDFILSKGAIILGFTFSAGVGIIFGWAPAKKASELNPIDALRSE